jgi:hypothetical protein
MIGSPTVLPRWVPILLTVIFFLTSTLTLAQNAPRDNVYTLREADWPCHGRYQETFSAGAFWQGPLLESAVEELEREPVIRKLAETVVAPDTAIEAAKVMIHDYAASLPESDLRGRSLALLFAAILNESNLYRRFILEGIVGMMGRRRLAAQALAESETEYQSLAVDPSPEAEVKRRSIERLRFWQNRAYDKAAGEARFLCQRLISLESKLGALARAVSSNL